VVNAHSVAYNLRIMTSNYLFEVHFETIGWIYLSGAFS